MLAPASSIGTLGSMPLRDSIDDLDALIRQLTELRQDLSLAALRGNDIDALWDVEAGLRHLAQRATTRADMVALAIELQRAPGAA